MRCLGKKKEGRKKSQERKEEEEKEEGNERKQEGAIREMHHLLYLGGKGDFKWIIS